MINRINNIRDNPPYLLRFGIIVCLSLLLLVSVNQLAQFYSHSLLKAVSNKEFADLDEADFADFEKAQNIESVLQYFPSHDDYLFLEKLYDNSYLISKEFNHLFYNSKLYENKEFRAHSFTRMSHRIQYLAEFRESNIRPTFDSLLYYLPIVNLDSVSVIPRIGHDEVNQAFFYTDYDDTIIINGQAYEGFIKLIDQLKAIKNSNNFAYFRDSDFYLKEEIAQFYNSYKYGFLIYDIARLDVGSLKNVFEDYYH